jgi:hypothetical protein
LAADSASERLYLLRAEEGDAFRTGVCADGRQAIVGMLRPEMTVYFFAPDGALLGREAQAWEVPAPRSPSGGHDYSKEFGAAQERQVRRWQAQVGFRPGTIRVRKVDDGVSLAIEDYPEGLLEELTGGHLPAEERAELEARLRRWRESGSYVLHFWDGEYHVSGEGEVSGS